MTPNSARHRICEVFPEDVLHAVATSEAEYQREAIAGRPAHSDPDVLIPAVVCAERYLQAQPIFALVRSWCAAGDVAHFNEMQALRAEVARLHGTIETAIHELESPWGSDKAGTCAFHLRRALGLAIPKRKRGEASYPR